MCIYLTKECPFMPSTLNPHRSPSIIDLNLLELDSHIESSFANCSLLANQPEISGQIIILSIVESQGSVRCDQVKRLNQPNILLFSRNIKKI